MNSSDERESERTRDRQRRHKQIKSWAEYVRTHPDAEWGEQVNELVNAQVESARHFEDERPDLDELRTSPLLDDEE